MSIRRTFLCGVGSCRRRITVAPEEHWIVMAPVLHGYPRQDVYCWRCSAMGTHFNPRKRMRIAAVSRAAARLFKPRR